jgi:hypothetical protein
MNWDPTFARRGSRANIFQAVNLELRAEPGRTVGKTRLLQGAQVCASADQPALASGEGSAEAVARLRPSHLDGSQVIGQCRDARADQWTRSLDAGSFTRVQVSRAYHGFQIIVLHIKNAENCSKIVEKEGSTWAKLPEPFCTSALSACPPCCVATWEGVTGGG